MKRNFLFLLTITIVSGFAVSTVSAQSSVKLSGSLFSDYVYVFSSPDGAHDGENSFDLRRVNFSADFVISDQFDGRLRLEAVDATVTNSGKQAAFIKDMYVRWKNVWGKDHNVMFGISRPPLWAVSEKHWGYRGLDRTIMAANKHASSRDLGVAVNGPMTADGSIKYAFMFANNSGGKQETDKFKRLYGQLEFNPTEKWVASLGGDYYAFEGGTSVAGNAFVGYKFDHAKLGVEGFIAPKHFDTPDDDDTLLGVSVFGSYDLSETSRLIGRFDSLDRNEFGDSTAKNWFIAGYSWMPNKGIEIIPNLIYNKLDTDNDPTMTGRLTVLASF